MLEVQYSTALVRWRYFGAGLLYIIYDDLLLDKSVRSIDPVGQLFLLNLLNNTGSSYSFESHVSYVLMCIIKSGICGGSQ